MLPNGELDVLSVRQGDKNHQYNCRVRPTGQDGGGATGDCGNRGPNVDLGGQEAVLLCVSYRWAAVGTSLPSISSFRVMIPARIFPSVRTETKKYVNTTRSISRLTTGQYVDQCPTDRFQRSLCCERTLLKKPPG